MKMRPNPTPCPVCINNSVYAPINERNGYITIDAANGIWACDWCGARFTVVYNPKTDDYYKRIYKRFWYEKQSIDELIELSIETGNKNKRLSIKHRIGTKRIK